MNDTSQADLFGSTGFDVGPIAAGPCGIDPLPPLAIPCGFQNRRNAPCRRLGNRLVTIDGDPFQHRGFRIVHCDAACFRNDVAEPGGAGEIEGS